MREEQGILRFKDFLVAPILSGQKTQTRRRGVDRKFYIGQQLRVQNSDTAEFFAEATVENVFPQRLGDISEAEAHKDGFASKADFLAAIKEIYAGIEEDETVTVVEFKVVRN